VPPGAAGAAEAPAEPVSEAAWVRRLVGAAVECHLRGDAAGVTELVHALAGFDDGVVMRHAGEELRRALPWLWDAGWQPAEVVRQARRTSARAGRLVAAAVLADHAGRQAASLDERWARQVDELAAAARPAYRVAATPDWALDFARREGLRGETLAAAVVDAVGTCSSVGRLPSILPPPGRSRSDSTGSANPRAKATADEPLLAKVRALLNKAESTTFEAEAATFTAKAQELMARHSLDAARLWDRAGRDERPITIRLPLDEPYIAAKSLLLQFVAVHSRCQSVYLERYAMAAVIGFAPDVAATELLFTSLLVQSHVALQVEAAAAGPGSRVRSRSFRSSFLLAYAHRIEERLAAVSSSVQTGAVVDGSLLPVLVARTGAVDEAVEEMFGELRTTRVRGGRDALAWARGQLAADRAQLNGGVLGTGG
jgi:hypothetical protein